MKRRRHVQPLTSGAEHALRYDKITGLEERIETAADARRDDQRVRKPLEKRSPALGQEAGSKSQRSHANRLTAKYRKRKSGKKRKLELSGQCPGFKLHARQDEKPAHW
jgi:hypothetical protein